MTIPHDGTATTWRELADQLRPEQIAELDGWECGGYEAAKLLFTARVWAGENVADTVMFSHVAAPPDAAELLCWCRDNDGAYSRDFTTAPRRFGETMIYVNGRQLSDGRCVRWITLWANEADHLSPAQAREFAAMLVRVADEIDRPC